MLKHRSSFSFDKHEFPGRRAGDGYWSDAIGTIRGAFWRPGSSSRAISVANPCQDVYPLAVT
jgi:hypothetical protein